MTNLINKKNIMILPLGVSFCAFCADTSDLDSSMTSLERSLENTFLTQGMFELGGSASFGHSSTTGGLLYASPRFQYFVTNDISIGATAQLLLSEDYQAYGLGPSASYYFWKRGRWASFLGQSIIYNWSQHEFWEDESGVDGNTRLGISYFFNENISIGANYGVTYSLHDSDSESFGNGNLDFTVYF